MALGAIEDLNATVHHSVGSTGLIQTGIPQLKGAQTPILGELLEYRDYCG